MSIIKDNYITPKGYSKLTSEHDHLLLKERPEILKVIQWAAGNGDRSENADYIYGKKRLREIDRRMRYLKKQIERANIIDPTKQSPDSVKFGATVTIIDDQEELRTYSIVGTDEIDLNLGFISFKSPIARALMGKEVGDDIIIRTPKGTKEAIITSISFQEIY